MRAKLDWAATASKFHVISARDILAFGRMERYQDVRDGVRWLGVDQPPLALLFISHRWETLAHPDPSGRQHQAIQSLLRAICTCAQALLVPKGERLSLIPSLELEGALQAEEIMRRAVGFGPFGDGGPCIGGKDAQMVLEREFEARKDDRGAFRDWLAGMIGIWLDYTCMPQHPLAAEEKPEFRQTLLELDTFVESSTVVALRHVDDDYAERGWCASEFFLGSAQSFARGLFVDIDRLANAQLVAIPDAPRPASLDAATASVMMESYRNDLAAWRAALQQWSLSERPLIREHVPNPWESYRAMQGSAFAPADADPNPFRRVLDAISSMETSLVQDWLMGERSRTLDLGKAMKQLMHQHELHCAKNSDLVYLGFVIASNGWIDAFRPLLRECLRRYVEAIAPSADAGNNAWPELVVTLFPIDQNLRELFFAVRPNSAATWYSRLRSSDPGDRHERGVITQIRTGLEQRPLCFAFVEPTMNPG